MDIPELKTVLSAAFIVFGAAVFYISSLISGHNIYKDLSFNIALLVTTIIGFTLFIFSPLCFVILFPGLFGLNWSAASRPLTPLDYLCEHSNNVAQTLNIIHELVLGHLLWSFSFAAAGLGLIIGCLSAMDARSGILQWVRSKTGLEYPIFSYGLTWDDLLMRVKSNGRIQLKVGPDLIEGQLVTSSIKKEPKEIVLKNYRKSTVGSFDGIEPEDGHLLVTEQAKIEEIRVPSESFKPSRSSVSHSTESFYCGLVALGCIILATSFRFTATFLRENTFIRLSQCYAKLALVLVITGAVATIISYRMSLKDYFGKYAAMVLSPATSCLIMFNTFLLVPALAPELNELFPGSVKAADWKYASLVCFLYTVFAITYVIIRKNDIINEFDRIIKTNNLSKDLMKELYESIYIVDLINVTGSRNLVRDLLKGHNTNLWFRKIFERSCFPRHLAREVKECNDSLDKQFAEVRDLIIKEKNLVGDEINVFLFLRKNYLAKETKRQDI